MSAAAQGSLDGGSSPSTPSAREQSSTAYESLTPQAAETLFGEVSAGVVEHPAGGPPPLTVGEKSLGFTSDYAESIDLGPSPSGSGEMHAVAESIVPMALETGEGKYTPLDLSLHEVPGGFAPAFGLTPVRIPLHAQEGASLLDSGVSLAPVTEAGSPLGGSGVEDHSGVFYGNAGSGTAGVQDMSAFAKPTVSGFEWYDVLFSVRSPEHLYFKVGLPEGAGLTQDSSGDVQVVREGKTIATIPKPEASDAEGVPVATTVSLSGDVMEVSVPRGAGAVRYPVTLDPETTEDTTFRPSLHPNWVACASSQCPLGNEANFGISEFPEGGNEYVAMLRTGAVKASEWMAYEYKTQGKSKIYALKAETKERDLNTETETLFEFYAPGGIRQNWGLLANNSETLNKSETYMCPVENVSTCEAGQGANENMVEFVKRVLGEGESAFEDRLYNASVSIAQEEAPVVKFNTTTPNIQVKEPNGTIIERENILYPTSKGWIGPHSSTAFEMTAEDHGVGVSFAVADHSPWSREVFLKNEGLCKGVQCPEKYVGKYTYYTTTPGFTTPMPSGEYEIQGRAEDEVKLVGETHVKVRVDATAPEAIKLVGWPAADQIGEGVYKIKAEATDGKTGTPSSGIASLKLGIDGAEAGEPKGSCPSGPCTASAEWTINGGQLSAGVHTLTVVATDNAGNVSHEDFPLFVHHATPMALGPGSLDPQSGNYTLGNSDVSMGAGLTLNRAYSSRNLTAGVEGGLGPQWSMSLSGSESLEELADGSMLLIAANGGETIFEKNSKGEFESPNGDANVTLAAEVNEQGVPVAYTVKNAAAGTTMRFARAGGYLQTAPTYYGEIGWEGPGTGQLNTPMGVASDAKGDAWVADTKNNRIEQFNPEGEYVSQFGSIGTGGGELKEPRGVAVDAKGNIWVTDTGNNRIEEFNEKGEFTRVPSTEGAGALKGPQGIATDSSGNVWVVDTGDNRVVEFNEKGEYIREASKTVGAYALSEPIGVAIDSSGDAWVTDAKNHRVVEFGPTGTALKEVGKEGTGNGEFQTPTGIAVNSENDLYVADYTADRVQELNAKGEYLTKFGSAGANGAQFKAPYLMGVDTQGALLVADSENSRVQRWAHSAWLPAVSEGPAATSQVAYTYKAVRAASGTLIEPTEVVAPHAAALSCAPTIKIGCRALILKYAEKTTATESVWGEYEGRLSEVFFAAYNPATKFVEEKTAVARYAYDAKGRLRSEWNPRVKPQLKTVYGYDAEGHVTAVSPANQEPWLIHYGTIPVDASPGRVLSVIRPAASTEIGNQTAPSNTSSPTLSSSEPKVGVKISVSSHGTWSNSPLTYSYQWERCNSSGLECVAIAGAVNEAYYPTATDEKHTLVAQVSAINAGGTTAAPSAATGLVGAGTPNSPAPEPPNPGTNAVSTVEYAVPVSGTGLPSLTEAEVKKWGQKDYPLEGTAVFPPDTPMGWPAKEYGKATISYFDEAGHTVNVANAAGGISTTEYSETNNVTKTLSAENRVLALKEGEKSEAAASKLDSRKVYNEEGDELLETLGPEHKVKLSNGSEVQARHHVKYIYDQDAPSGRTYRLVTETVDSALVDGKEEDRRVTRTHYYGQKGLGWALRKPTSVTVDPNGLRLTTTTVYDPSTGAVIETGTGKEVTVKESRQRPEYQGSFGSYGTGDGQLREPEGGLATDASGNVWVSDTENSRLEEFNAKGEFVRTTGSYGEGAGQFRTTYGVTVDSKGNVWATDSNDRVEEFNGEGVFMKAFGWGVSNGENKFQVCTTSCRAGLQGSGDGEFYIPQGIVVDSKGDIFVADRGNDRVQEFNESLAWVRNISKAEEKEGPFYINLDSSGNLWVAYSWDTQNQIAEFNTTEGKLIRMWGTEGSGTGQVKDPYGVAVGAEGDIWLSEYGNNRVQVFTPAGEYLYGFGSKGNGPGQFNYSPHGLAFFGSSIYVLDSGIWWENTGNSRIEKWHIEPPVEYQSSFGSYGAGNGQLREPEGGLATDASGNVWVSDTENSRLEEFNAKGEFVRAKGSYGEGAGQFRTTYGVTVDSKGNVWATDEGNDRVEEFTGGGVFMKVFGWGVSNGENKFQVCTTSCRAGLQGSGDGEFYIPQGIVVDSKGDIFVADRGNDRVQEFNESLAWVRNISKAEEKEGPFYINLDSSGNLWVAYSWDTQNQIAEFNTTEGKLIRMWGTEGTTPGQVKDPYGVAVGAEGDIWLSEYGNNRVQVFTPAGEYLYGFGSKGNGPGQFNYSPHGLAFFGSSIYVLDSGIWWENTGNSRIEKWHANAEIEKTETSHDKQMIYYTAAANERYPSCGGHVEWEGMPCETRPGAQPNGSQAPSLPVTTVSSYNMWGEPGTTTETFPANEKYAETSRTKRITYDEAGRPLTSEETSTSATDKSMPKVTTAESFGLVCGQTKTVRCVTESTVEGETTYTITSVYDTLGRLISYTDADKNTTTYEYETGGDGRLLMVSDAKGYQDYAYDPTTGLMTKLLDSGAKTFTASYDVEGNMTGETYPNGMTAAYTHDQSGEATGIEYVKTTHCAEKCVLFSETIAPSIHGETISRSNTLTNDAYTYDSAGRLTETNETPTGKGCTTRVYAYDEESNRTSLTTREPGLEGKCATEGGAVETHSYDEANRLTDTGVTYDPLGNTTKLPAGDAGGYELTSSFYVDGQVEKQTQNGQENVYSIDPVGRVRKSVGKGASNVTAIDHYAGSGEALSWKDEEAGKYTRLIPGPEGSLCGTETNGEAPILQLHDLQGNIVATAALAETETKLLSTYNSTEFGVHTNGTPPTKYSWLGASAASSELSSGALLYGTVAYQPQLGRALQTKAVVPPGMAVSGATSETTPYTVQIAAWSIAANNATGELDTQEFERQKAAEREAEEKACPIASMCVTPEEPGGVEYLESYGSGGPGGHPVASASFDHVWSVPPAVAYALGYAITVSGSDIGHYVLGFVHIPSWFTSLLDHMLGGELNILAGDLIRAGTEAAPGTLVDIHVWGAFRYRFYFDVGWWIDV